MLKAQIHGKLPTSVWATSEDLLTSAVFGTLSNLPDRYAIEILALAEPLAEGQPPAMSGPLKWTFWPWWNDELVDGSACEPDVVVNDKHCLTLIEAKLWSPFGTEPDRRDQLDREYAQAHHRSLRHGFPSFHLVVVTGHITCPRDEVISQLSRNPDFDPTLVSWLSWREIGRQLANWLQDPLRVSEHGWVRDLLDILKRVGASPYSGFDDLLSDARTLIERAGKLDVGSRHGPFDLYDLTIEAARLPMDRLDWLRSRIA
jgi:hypothetical protein